MDNQSPSNQPDTIVVETTPLYLPIKDEQLIAIMNDAEMRGKKTKAKEEIERRSKANVAFWRGNQVNEDQLDTRYQQAHIDNVVHQDLENQIKLAAGRMPDIFVAPPDKDDFNMEIARDLQQWLRERLDSGTIKRIIKNGLRTMNLKLTSAVKARWDYSRNDFVFELVDPENLLFSEGAKIPEDGYTIDGVDVVFHYVEEPTQVILAKFKKKADALKQEIAANTKRQELPSRLRYTEAHFRWFDDQGRMNEGVAWRYGNLILDSMKEPYFDYDNLEVNYFDRPRKPFMLLSYLNLGDSIYEATTAFEQGTPINRIINKRRRQITEISDRAVPKIAFSGKAMTKEQARNISPSPQEGIVLNDDIDDVRKGIFIIPATPPNPILYNDMLDLRGRIDSIFSTHGTTRGETKGSESGISKQISREGDMVTSDDIVDIVIERIVSEMAGWAMQFARLFYDDDRKPLRITNNEGETEFVELNREKLETDIQVVVKASTADKATRRADALQMLEAKVTDPYTFFEDIEVPNPKERTKRLMTFIMSQQTGDWTKYLEAVDVDIDVDKADEQDAQRDIEAILAGGQPEVKKNPSETYVSTFMAFVNSPEYEQLDPQIKALVAKHVEQLRAHVEKAIADKGGQPEAGPDPNLVPQQAGFQPQVDAGTLVNQGGQGGTPPAPASPIAQALQNRVQSPQTQATQPGVVNR